MPWARAILRGQRVLARVKESGELDAPGGRVEIRYKPNDGRAYRAAARNLERVAGEALLPDDACAPADDAKDAKESKAAAKSDKKERAAAAVASARLPDEAWIVYADGACSGNPGPAGLGIVIVEPGGRARHEGYEYLGTATNNIAELMALFRAAERIPDGAVAVLHTDSQYSIGVLSKGWKAKANQELIAKVKAALAPRKGWRLQYVPGHAGVPLNERADELAREAIRTRASRLPEKPGS